jgi:hypothetical protein
VISRFILKILEKYLLKNIAYTCGYTKKSEENLSEMKGFLFKSYLSLSSNEESGKGDQESISIILLIIYNWQISPYNCLVLPHAVPML